MSDATATRIDLPGLVPEELPSLAGIAKEVGGAWPAGWYPAVIIEGYTAKNYTFDTRDSLSSKGDSRNLRIALTVESPNTKRDDAGNSVTAGATRNTFYSQNYRVEDLTAANVQRVKDGEADTRLRIALSSLGQIEKAIGLSFRRHPEGHINPMPLVGQKVDVRLSINKESGYNDVTAFAPFGSRAARAAK